MASKQRDQNRGECRKSYVAALSLCIAPMGASVVHGQETQESAKLEPITVTATRRSESLQDVPISIAAIGGVEIAQRNLVSMTDFLRTVPGVNQLELGAGQSEIIIRGIAADPVNDGYSLGLTTAVFLGEVPLSAGRVGQTDLRLIDVDRVEILRGPQGTEFGSGSLAGTLRYIPNAPDLTKTSGDIKVGYSFTGGAGGSNDDVEGVLNIPLVDNVLAARAVLYRYNDGGYVNNVAASNPAFAAPATAQGIQALLGEGRVGDAHTTGGRVALLWKPSDDLKVTLTYLRQKLEQDGSLVIQPFGNAYYPALSGGYDQTRYLFTNTFGGGDFLGDDNRISNALVQYSFGWGEVSNSLSYTEQAFTNRNDIGIYFPYAGNPVPQDFTQSSRDVVEELRFTSKFDGPVGLIAGLYYEDSKAHRLVDNEWGGTLAGLAEFIPTAADYPVAGGGDRALGTYDWRNNVTQKAAYGELSYEIVKGLKATFGARTFRYDTSLPISDSGYFFGGSAATDYSATNSGQVYKANLSYKATQDTLLYATWSQGFRLGFPQAPLPQSCLDSSGNVVGLPGVRDSALVKPDNLDNYELGAKFSLMDSRLDINVDVFDIDWNGIPVSVLASCGIPITVNAGKANSRGAELETKYAVTQALQVELSASYISAKLSNDAAGIGSAGDRLPGSPKYNARAGLTYKFTAAGYPAFVQSDVGRVGGFYSQVGQKGPELGNYTQVGLRGGVSVSAFDFLLYANNLTNSHGYIWEDPSLGSTSILRPVTIGFTVGYKF